MNHSHATIRWLVMKGRDQEALMVLSRINQQTYTETFVDTCIELEELRRVTSCNSKGQFCHVMNELYQRKYR